MTVWNESIVYRVLHVATEHYASGGPLDEDVKAYEGAGIELAESLALALWAYEIQMPLKDSHMAAILARDGRPVPLTQLPRGAVVQTADGRLGLTVGRGSVVESSGPTMSIVDIPENDRYIAAWLIPGVEYLNDGVA